MRRDPFTALGHFILALVRRLMPSTSPESPDAMVELRLALEKQIAADEARHG